MYRNSAKRLSAFVVSIAAALLLLPSGALFGAERAAGTPVAKARTTTLLRKGVSQPLRTMPTMKPGSFDTHNLREIELKSHPPLAATRPHDPLVQATKGSGAIPSPLSSFDGVG